MSAKAIEYIAKEMNRKENSIIARYKNIMKNEET